MACSDDPYLSVLDGDGGQHKVNQGLLGDGSLGLDVALDELAGDDRIVAAGAGCQGDGELKEGRPGKAPQYAVQ